MTAWGWVGLVVVWAFSLLVAWRKAVAHGHTRYWQGREDWKPREWEVEYDNRALTRAAAQAAARHYR